MRTMIVALSLMLMGCASGMKFEQNCTDYAMSVRRQLNEQMIENRIVAQHPEKEGSPLKDHACVQYKKDGAVRYEGCLDDYTFYVNPITNDLMDVTEGTIKRYE